jgi:tripartite-type tricarboxylate transporter receptor subunit TctC
MIRNDAVRRCLPRVGFANRQQERVTTKTMTLVVPFAAGGGTELSHV